MELKQNSEIFTTVVRHGDIAWFSQTQQKKKLLYLVFKYHNVTFLPYRPPLLKTALAKKHKWYQHAETPVIREYLKVRKTHTDRRTTAIRVHSGGLWMILTLVNLEEMTRYDILMLL